MVKRTPVQYHYGKFPPKNIDLGKLIPYIGAARAAVARYDGLLQAVPGSSILLSPLTTQEAVLSSRIEGTQATIGDVYEYEASSDIEKSRNRNYEVFEVLN